jgi:glycolate oxidase FAD binding subunit
MSRVAGVNGGARAVVTVGTRAVADQVREAAARGAHVRVVGRGRWLHANRPTFTGDPLMLAECSGIVDYVPGDLTLTARAGTSLAEIAYATRDHGQWLALDPCGGDEGSIGATVATASSGPHAAAFGTPRDSVLGVEFVTGAGDIVRGGGRVVKNVAGFDLVRLVTGAWGTLGVLTEVTVRLRALPIRSETLAITLDADSVALDAVGSRIRTFPASPYACELVSAGLAVRLGLPGATTFLVRIGGNGESVRAQRRQLDSLGIVAEADESVWRALRTAETADCAVWRLSSRPSCFGTTWHTAIASIESTAGAWLHGSPVRGVVRCVVPHAIEAGAQGQDVAAAVTHPFSGTRIAEVLPASLWRMIPGVTRDALSRRIRRAFDPDSLINAGIFGEQA